MEQEINSLVHTIFQAPELPEYLIPSIGQEFKSYQETYDFYNNYSKHTGFGIKKGQRNNSRRYLQCVREGIYQPCVPDDERQRDKLTKRTGCKAFMRFKERKDGTCVVKDIGFDHNHKLLLSPSMMVFLHSHKKVDNTLRDYIKDLYMSNIKHVNIMGLLTRLHHGRENLPCHNKDVLNM